MIRGILGGFLFAGDDVYKKVAVLSGGERNRLALAMLLVEPANCLLLDEPTNHLDLTAKEVLLEALLEYEGTVVLVAHDRYILDRLPSQVIEVGHGAAVRYLGNYEEYLAKKLAMEAHGGSAPTQAAGVNGTARPPLRPSGGAAVGAARDGAAPAATEPRADREAARRQARAEEKRRREAENVEATIAAKETELAELAGVMNDPDFYQTHPEPQRLFSSYARLKREVETLYERLERLSA